MYTYIYICMYIYTYGRLHKLGNNILFIGNGPCCRLNNPALIQSGAYLGAHPGAYPGAHPSRRYLFDTRFLQAAIYIHTNISLYTLKVLLNIFPQQYAEEHTRWKKQAANDGVVLLRE